jgi:hypothetical protein
MKGERMKQRMTDRGMGLFITAMAFLFTLTTFVQAEASQASFKGQLRQNGISMKLVRLDRTDGFNLGLSITGPKSQPVTLSPGFNGTLLAESSGSEMTLQSDSSGTTQIIQADGDVAYIFCIVQQVIALLGDWSTCEDGDTLCQINVVIGFVGGVVSCGGDNSTLF